jgi:hypothetical protein
MSCREGEWWLYSKAPHIIGIDIRKLRETERMHARGGRIQICTERLALLCRLPRAGSKFIATRKYWNRTNTFLFFPYIRLSAGDWSLGVVKGGDVSSPSFLCSFRCWGLGLEVWTPLKDVFLIWLTSRWQEIAARILCRDYADAR